MKHKRGGEAGMTMPWPWIALAVAAYCIVRGTIDLRAHRYVWGGLGVLAGIALLLVPIRSEAVKLDLIPTANP